MFFEDGIYTKKSNGLFYLIDDSRIDNIKKKLESGKDLWKFKRTADSYDGFSDYDIAKEMIEWGDYTPKTDKIMKKHKKQIDEENELKQRNNTDLFNYVKIGDYDGFVNKFEYSTAKSNSESNNDSQPRIEIGDETYTKIVAFVKETAQNSKEVGGLLKYRYDGDSIIIDDMCILPQRIGGADFSINEEAMMEFMKEHMMDEDFSNWSGWWHSHHNMGLFWSGTDDEMFNNIRCEGKVPHCLGLVFNTSGDFRARFDMTMNWGRVKIDSCRVDILRNKERLTIEELKGLPPVPIIVDYTKESIGKYVTNKEVYDKVNYPKTLEDLYQLAIVHAGIRDNWSMDDEARYWGVTIPEDYRIWKNKRK